MSQETQRLVEAAAAAALCPDERYRHRALGDARAAAVAVLRELASLQLFEAEELIPLADEIEGVAVNKDLADTDTPGIAHNEEKA